MWACGRRCKQTYSLDFRHTHLKGSHELLEIRALVTSIDFTLPFEFGSAAKGLTQDGLLELKLRLIIGMLIVAAAATSKVGTWRFCSFRRRLQYLVEVGAHEAGLLLRHTYTYFFAGEHQGN